MTAKFKKYQSVQFCKESQLVYRDVLDRPDLAESKGVVLRVRDLDDKFLYVVELVNGEVREYAESHLEAA